MSQPRRTLACLLIFALCITTFIFRSPIPVAAVAADEASQAHPDAPLAAATPDPLPHGCGGVTPPGEEEPPCCISGFVYIDGQIIAGAEVEIQSPRGDQVTMFTQVYSGTEARPYYRLSLSAAPLSIAVGETITVTARYSSHEKSMRYVVQPGGQQVNVVLARNQADDYVYDRQIWGQAEAGKFNGPLRMDIDNVGNVYVIDNINARIQVFDKNGIFIRQWGRLGNLPGEFSHPEDIAVDASGNVYVSDSGKDRIQKFSSTGKWLTSWGSSGSGNGEMFLPIGIAIDSIGNIYVSDSGNNRIQKFNNIGQWIASWGKLGDYNGEFSRPTDVEVNRNDIIYVVDSGNNRIQKFSNIGQWLGNFGSRGNENGRFSWPNGISFDSDNNIYIADTLNNRIQKFDVTGQWMDSWGVTL